MRARSSFSKRVFSIAITAWSAKVWSSCDLPCGEESGLRPSDGNQANGCAVAQHRDSPMLWKFTVLASPPST